MRNLLRLSIVILGLGGLLGASACTACLPPAKEAATDTSTVGATSYTCGTYTHLVGTQCMPDRPSK
jgi:hypothetical protein